MNLSFRGHIWKALEFSQYINTNSDKTWRTPRYLAWNIFYNKRYNCWVDSITQVNNQQNTFHLQYWFFTLKLWIIHNVCIGAQWKNSMYLQCHANNEKWGLKQNQINLAFTDTIIISFATHQSMKSSKTAFYRSCAEILLTFWDELMTDIPFEANLISRPI